MSRAGDLALVLIGGALGGAARIGLQELLPADPSPFPWDLLAINVVGSTLLAAVVARTQARGPWAGFPAIGPGFFGGFTTFSSLAVLQWSAGVPGWAAAAALAGTIAACVGGALVGWALGDRPRTPVDVREVLEEENE
ncbi:CrcB family protein [Demequina pelophila]|uniref:CrcB family protein n=1 Tax=Demequina pelophila TaxID=1638984 RepID=UPI0007818A30|nr:CrcB family protein [Demequina pelophila]